MSSSQPPSNSGANQTTTAEQKKSLGRRFASGCKKVFAKDKTPKAAPPRPRYEPFLRAAGFDPKAVKRQYTSAERQTAKATMLALLAQHVRTHHLTDASDSTKSLKALDNSKTYLAQLALVGLPDDEVREEVREIDEHHAQFSDARLRSLDRYLHLMDQYPETGPCLSGEGGERRVWAMGDYRNELEAVYAMQWLVDYWDLRREGKDPIQLWGLTT